MQQTRDKFKLRFWGIRNAIGKGVGGKQECRIKWEKKTVRQRP